ncbi:insulin receptor-like isoform X2 [Brevipalpus obovatus]|uniref:insulin receptor-like isoform X2 n=1 Tax=Brevipalpus obovatus TaxID=246614 RepID=UPI003D9E703A
MFKKHYHNHNYHHHHHQHHNHCNISVLVSIVILIFSSSILQIIITPCEAFEKPCKSIDIRYSQNQSFLDSFRKLENCTVIEGSLQIVLFSKQISREIFENLTFPLLTEVTDYVLFFRAYGIRSLGSMFPNLSVIRGQKLFDTYALAIFEMKDLEEIGLVNLTTISKGAVYIAQNSNLCFAETINWNLIAKAGKGSNHVDKNKPLRDCSKCNRADNTATCPTVNSLNGLSYEKGVSLCWNKKHCQRICSSDCESRNLTCRINDPNECCDPQCIGGCFGPTSSDCVVCKNFVTPNERGKICKERCSKPNEYEYLGRRCISYTDCLAFATPEASKGPSEKIYTFEKSKASQCLHECPANFQPHQTNAHECVRCEGMCRKECEGDLRIYSAADARRFRGCTIITGWLEIAIQGGGGDVMAQLEENFQYLEVITGFLRVTRSYPLITLNFFKNLRIIKGQKLDRSKYSLLLVDNQNLQELFPLDPSTGRSKVNLTKGLMFTHLNPKLCLSVIKSVTRIGGEGEEDISLISNGEKTTCNVINLNVTVDNNNIVRDVGINDVYVHYDNFLPHLSDHRVLLGYLIYVRETPSGNVSIYGGTDACNNNGWKVLEDEPRLGSSSKRLEYNLDHLKPFTRYALYVKTYTIKINSGDDKGGLSDIVYFVTEPTNPTQPTNLLATSLSYSEVILHWSPPKKPNGIITHYNIKLRQEPIQFSTNRDFCIDPLDIDASIMPEERVNASQWLQNTTTTESPTQNLTNEGLEECCKCNKAGTFQSEEEVRKSSTFEDYLLDHIYVKNLKMSKNRVKRDLISFSYVRKFSERSINESYVGLQSLDFENNSSLIEEMTNGSIIDVSEPLMMDVRVDLSTSYLFKNLSHYTRYSIEVKACQTNKTGAELCSHDAAVASILTMRKKDADEINPNSIIVTMLNTSSSSNLVKVKWDEPLDPNGQILAYHLEYKQYDASQRDNVHKCITRKEFIANGGVRLGNLNPGTYQIRVRAVSLAGKGNFTRYYQFDVPSTGLVMIILAIIAGLSFILVLSFLSAWFFLKRKYRPGRMIYASINPEYISKISNLLSIVHLNSSISSHLAHQPDEYEVAREDVKLLAEIGQGTFGMVYYGEMQSKDPDLPTIKCAIKTVNDPTQTRAFLNEANVMKVFDCHHVVRFLGVVSTSQPAWVIMELMTNGDLRNYLLKHRPDNEDGVAATPPSIQEIWRMSAEIADGMAYLGSKKFVHRDLAARNILVANDLTAKIGDFGMTRDIYETEYYRKDGQGLLPIRWMAPESLRDGIFTYFSDVWSYGVVLYEMSTLGAQPYQGLGSKEVVDYIIDGKIIEKPKGCPAKLYKLMTMCWERNPKKRPTFLEIIDYLSSDFESEEFLKVSFYAKAKSKQVTSRSTKDSTSVIPPNSDHDNKFDEENCDTANAPELDVSGDIKFFPTVLNLDVLNSTKTNQDSDTEDAKVTDRLIIPNGTSHVHKMNLLNSEEKDKSNSSNPTEPSATNSPGGKKDTKTNGALANNRYNTTVC